MEAAENHRRLPFPPRPDDEELADWMLDLAEVDAYYFGLAQTALGGGRVRVDTGAAAELRERLVRVMASREPEVNIEVIAQTRRYLESLDKLVVALSAFEDRMP